MAAMPTVLASGLQPSQQMAQTFETFNVTLKWKPVSNAADVAESGMFLYLRVRLAPTPHLYRLPLPPNVSMMTVVGSGSTPHTAALTDEGGRANLVLSLWVAKLDPRLTFTQSASVDNYEYAIRENILMMRSDTKPLGVIQDAKSNVAMVARAEITLPPAVPAGSPYRVLYALQRRIDAGDFRRQYEPQRRYPGASPHMIHAPIPGGYRPPYRPAGRGAGTTYSTASYQTAAQAQQRGPPTLDRDDPDAVYKNVYIHDDPDLLKMDLHWSVSSGHAEDPWSYLKSRTLPGADYPVYETTGEDGVVEDGDDEALDVVDNRGASPAARAAMLRTLEFNAALETQRMETVEWRKQEMTEKPNKGGEEDEEEESDDDSLG